MIVRRIGGGPLDSLSYLVTDGEKSVLIDAGPRIDLDVELVLLTHAHFDHVANLEPLRKRGAKAYMHPMDRELLASFWSFGKFFGVEGPVPQVDEDLNEGVLDLGWVRIEVLHTPGHTPGSCCFLIDGILFTGDTLFKGTFGRTDLPGGDRRDMARSLRRILSLSPDILVLPGHGEATTIGDERELLSLLD